MQILFHNDTQHIEADSKVYQGQDSLSLVTRSTGMSRTLYGKQAIADFNDCVKMFGIERTMKTYYKLFDRSPELKSHKGGMKLEQE